MLMKKLERLLPALGFGLVPLAFSPLVFHPFATAKWAVIFALAVVSAALWAARGRHWDLPGIGLREMALALAFSAATGANSVAHDIPLGNESLLARLAFPFLVLAAYNGGRRALAPVLRALLPATAIVAFMSLRYALVIETESTARFDFSPFFGNTNITAEFLGISMVFQALALSRMTGRRTGWAVEALWTLSLTAVYFTLCRSVMLALACATPLLWWKMPSIRRPLLRASAIGAVVIGVCQAAFSPRAFQPQHLTGQDRSANERIEMWAETLRLVRDHPLGVGLGQFEFAYLPYKTEGANKPSEQTIDRSPHNEFLRVLAEDGVHGFTLLALLAGVLCWRLAARVRAARPDAEVSVWAAYFVYLLVQALFQFPVENPFPYFATAMVSGFALREVTAPVRLAGPLRATFVRASALVGGAAVGALAFAFVYSQSVLSSAPGDPERAARACRAFPANWRACLYQAEREISSGRPERAREVLRPLLNRQKFNFPAMRLWSTTAFMTGRDEEGCRMLWSYHQLFSAASSMGRELDMLCPPETQKRLETEERFRTYRDGSQRF